MKKLLPIFLVFPVLIAFAEHEHLYKYKNTVPSTRCCKTKVISEKPVREEVCIAWNKCKTEIYECSCKGVKEKEVCSNECK